MSLLTGGRKFKKKKKNRNSETICLTLVIHFYEFCNTLQSRPDISHTPTDPQRVSFSLILLETLERSFLSSFTLAPFLLISLSWIRTPSLYQSAPLFLSSLLSSFSPFLSVSRSLSNQSISIQSCISSFLSGVERRASPETRRGRRALLYQSVTPATLSS